MVLRQPNACYRPYLSCQSIGIDAGNYYIHVIEKNVLFITLHAMQEPNTIAVVVPAQV